MYTTMHLSEFDFTLPPELIAQTPPPEGRDHCRLMIVDRTQTSITHHRFFDLLNVLQSGDVVVINNSKVFPARLNAYKPSGGCVEILLLRHLGSNADGVTWEAILRMKKPTIGTTLNINKKTWAHIVNRISATSHETWAIQFHIPPESFEQLIEEVGTTPIPPYITHSPLSETALRTAYQTVYAKILGSAAAPTAGLHFSHELLKKLHARGVITTEITLHVGLGTFAPVRKNDIMHHHLHAEFATVSESTANSINAARKNHQRIIAVGTTVIRTLESFMHNGTLMAGEQWTKKYITPGYQFQCVDAAITNFHLPKSSLLILVSALAGHDLMKRAYQEAIAEHYSFFSFGDAMLIV